MYSEITCNCNFLKLIESFEGYTINSCGEKISVSISEKLIGLTKNILEQLDKTPDDISPYLDGSGIILEYYHSDEKYLLMHIIDASGIFEFYIQKSETEKKHIKVTGHTNAVNVLNSLIFLF